MESVHDCALSKHQIEPFLLQKCLAQDTSNSKKTGYLETHSSLRNKHICMHRHIETEKDDFMNFYRKP